MEHDAHLVGTADEVQVMFVQELGHHLCTEREGNAAVVLPPSPERPYPGPTTAGRTAGPDPARLWGA